MKKLLPWWRDMHIRPGSWPTSAWWPKYKSPEQLEQRLSEYPLTPKIFVNFMKDHIDEISLWDHTSTIKPSFRESLKFRIDICRFPVDEQGVALVHEAIHGIYRVTTHIFSYVEKEKYRKFEDLIEAEAQRFYNLNPYTVNFFVPK
jgi:hypothetical protein